MLDMNKFVVGVITAVVLVSTIFLIFWFTGADARNKDAELKRQTDEAAWQTKQTELKSISDKQKQYCDQLAGAPVKDVEAAKDCQYTH